MKGQVMYGAITNASLHFGERFNFVRRINVKYFGSHY